MVKINSQACLFETEIKLASFPHTCKSWMKLLHFSYLKIFILKQTSLQRKSKSVIYTGDRLQFAL